MCLKVEEIRRTGQIFKSVDADEAVICIELLIRSEQVRLEKKLQRELLWNS